MDKKSPDLIRAGYFDNLYALADSKGLNILIAFPGSVDHVSASIVGARYKCYAEFFCKDFAELKKEIGRWLKSKYPH